MSSDPGSDALGALLRRLEAGELGDPLPVVAYLAGQSVDLPPTELNESRRRSMLLLAAGGDPHRELEVDDRPVKALAVELHSAARQAELGAGLDDLVREARDLPAVRKAALFLAADVELAWRLFALGLLAEEIAGEELSDTLE